MTTAPLRRRSDRRVSVAPWLTREHQWSPVERAAVIAVVAIALGSLFLATYSLALGDPMPRRIDAGMVGNPAARADTVSAVQGVARRKLIFHRYPIHLGGAWRNRPATRLHGSRPDLGPAYAICRERRGHVCGESAGADLGR